MLQTAVVKAQDVYVYTTGNYTPVAVSKQVSSIIFGSTALTLRSSDGSTSSVPYELFSYFRFYQTPIPLSIQSAAVGEAQDPVCHRGGRHPDALHRRSAPVWATARAGLATVFPAAVRRRPLPLFTRSGGPDQPADHRRPHQPVHRPVDLPAVVPPSLESFSRSSAFASISITPSGASSSIPASAWNCSR